MSGPSILSRFTIVLWRPKSPGNVGSVARAMKNMGFARLRLADPIRFDDPDHFQREAERMAWNASNLLAAREEYPSVDAALSDISLVAATTSRPPDGHAILSPRELAPRLLEAASRGDVALLFGQEDIGLTKEMLGRCQLVGSIPVSDEYPSLNLSQAALIFLYELRLAALAAAGRESATEDSTPRAEYGRRAAASAGGHEAGSSMGDSSAGDRDPGELPTQAEREGFYARLFEALEAIGYFEGTAREHMALELRRLFNRAGLTRRELGILEGISHRISWALSNRPRGRKDEGR